MIRNIKNYILNCIIESTKLAFQIRESGKYLWRE